MHDRSRTTARHNVSELRAFLPAAVSYARVCPSRYPCERPRREGAFRYLRLPRRIERRERETSVIVGVARRVFARKSLGEEDCRASGGEKRFGAERRAITGRRKQARVPRNTEWTVVSTPAPVDSLSLVAGSALPTFHPPPPLGRLGILMSLIFYRTTRRARRCLGVRAVLLPRL